VRLWFEERVEEDRDPHQKWKDKAPMVVDLAQLEQTKTTHGAEFNPAKSVL
jgi:hypothetical protein